MEAPPSVHCRVQRQEVKMPPVTLGSLGPSCEGLWDFWDPGVRTAPPISLCSCVLLEA